MTPVLGLTLVRYFIPVYLALNCLNALWFTAVGRWHANIPLHCGPGPHGEHSRRFLADGLGTEC